MDPQVCLARIIELVWKLRDPHAVQGREEEDYTWSELSAAFEGLADWLRKGGFAPAASGQIFGLGAVAVGYPGMSLQSAPRFDKRPVKHVKSSRGNYRYALMVRSRTDDDCAAWDLVEYHLHNHNEINRWQLVAQLICPCCNSRGFLPSTKFPNRCTFCDGTENGE